MTRVARPHAVWLTFLVVSSCSAGVECDPSLHYVHAPDAATATPGERERCEGICAAEDISAGAFHTVVVVDRNVVLGWGDNRYGQLGAGPATAVSPGVVPAPPHGGLAIRARAGTTHTCAFVSVVATGRVRCVGLNLAGVMGPAVASDVSFMVMRPLLDAEFGAAHGAALIDQRPIASASAMWGDNRRHQIGLPFDEVKPIPFVDGATLDTISAGGLATCRARHGILTCTGTLALSESGYAADASDDERIVWPAFTQVATPTPVAQVSVGMAHACVIDDAGDVWCFGANLAGESGEGDDYPLAFRRIPLPGPAYAIETGGGFEVVEGDGSPLDYELVPDGAGPAHSCALVGLDGGLGSLYCWGDNRYGQLGDGSRESGPTPRRVPLADVVRVVTGARHTCAVVGYGDVWCWGDNSHGQLARPVEEWDSSDFPVPVSLRGATP